LFAYYDKAPFAVAFTGLDGFSVPLLLATHIHVGGAGVNGPIVVPLFDYSPPKTWTLFTGCVRATPATLTAILRAPAAYYGNVHTTQYPAGAIRGQL